MYINKHFVGIVSLISVVQMENGLEYRIDKLEKGPLQRFKNQNLLLKKFGEVGLQVYKAITGKRTTQELRKDLDMEPELFSNIIDYMQEAGMVKLAPSTSEEKTEKGTKGVEPSEEEVARDEAAPEAELAPEIGEAGKAPKGKKKTKPATKKVVEEEAVSPGGEIVPEEITPEEEIAPEEEISKEEPAEEGIEPELIEEEKPAKRKKLILKKEPEEAQEEEPESEEITPEEEIGPEEEISPEDEIAPEEEAVPKEEETPRKRKKKEEVSEEEISEEEKPGQEIEFSGLDEAPEEEGRSVEKTIRDKYGDIGLQVYTLIDGQRTAEEIMQETGLDEAKLVEILDFLDEQGIIKLEYPGGRGPEKTEDIAKKEVATEEFSPMVEEGGGKEVVADMSPVILPARAPVAIVKSVQLRAKTMLKYGDLGDKVLAAIDGKLDVVDLSLKLDMPLFKLMEILNFLRVEGGALLNIMPRTEVRRKYGDDGYSVFKKFGKEGLMLYELIGKELTIKQMSDKITTNKQLVFDMFLFIYEVLGIEMPINKDRLKSELGV